VYSYNFRAVKAFADYRHQQIRKNQPRHYDSWRKEPISVNRVRRKQSPARSRAA
jgi:hypothetical protein